MKTSNLNLKFKSLLFLCIIATGSLFAQPHQTIVQGLVVDFTTGYKVPFANIAVFDAQGEMLIGGSSGDENGLFRVYVPSLESASLRISAVGYEPLYRQLAISDAKELVLDNIELQPTLIALEGVVVQGRRIRAKAENGKTTYLVNASMQNAAHTGSDILAFIPGVRMDIMQNISLEGKQNILIMVNGRERDRNFLNQLKASQIDRVEVVSNPSSRFAADVEGVIHIILKEERVRGVDGHIYAELPTNLSETFIFPSYSVNYGLGKFNLFTSYSGELSYFDITEASTREYETTQDAISFTSRQFVNQRNWSHRFHYGADYHINSRNQLNFYAFSNPYSQEYSGNAELFKNGLDEPLWEAVKTDEDRNYSGYYSLYYRHLFEQGTQHGLSLETSFFHMNGYTSVIFQDMETGEKLQDLKSPLQRHYSARLDYEVPLNDYWSFSSGIQARNQYVTDAKVKEFFYENMMLAAYAEMKYSTAEFEILAGLRSESFRQDNDRFTGNRQPVWLPQINMAYRLNAMQSLNFSLRSSINYPAAYHLNPSVYREDPAMMYSGNPLLTPSRVLNGSAGYDHRFEHHFLSTRFFYAHHKDAIHPVMFMHEDFIFESLRENLGDITQYGLQLSGALSLGAGGGFHPHLRVFRHISQPNEMGRFYQINKRSQWAWDGGVSAFQSLGKGYIAAIMMNYASALNNIQGNYFSGAQYFISLEKSFNDRFKAGVVSALPFSGSYTYRGSEVYANDFTTHSQGDIHMSQFPFWLRLSYNFSHGSRKASINRTADEPEYRQRKGF